jgi:hypothetical protein
MQPGVLFIATLARGTPSVKLSQIDVSVGFSRVLIEIHNVLIEKSLGRIMSGMGMRNDF